MYFESMSLADEFGGECEEDFIQFGRDVFFITSYRSIRYCGVIRGELSSMRSYNNSLPAKDITPINARIYSESNDREMDIWVKLEVPQSSSEAKTVKFVVTPFKKSCAAEDIEYAKCGKSPHCIRSELFCDGVVNCALPGVPEG